jgi:deoxyribose-phosphate aldolase
MLQKTNVGITTVVGFPLGATTTKSKIMEAKEAIKNGANEIDMVINIGKFKDKEYDYILNEINVIKQKIGKNILKVIVETALLSKKEIKKISEIIKKSNAEFIKTSTGFSTRGASLEDIKIMNNVMQKSKQIKAAGGIKTIETLKKMINHNVTRIGTSSGVKILKNEKIKKE